MTSHRLAARKDHRKENDRRNLNMDRFDLTIELDDVRERIAVGQDAGRIVDRNGNTVGRWETALDDSDDTEDALRNKVRAALVEYRDFLTEQRGDADTPDEYEHFLVSRTQVESAMRVLWGFVDGLLIQQAERDNNSE